jgi:putative PIN family toxin of toxin-antitoxin system
MALTVVFDTNILFSATGWRDRPYQGVELARAEKIQAVSCAHIMDELSEKLAAKLAFSPEQVSETLADYLGFMPLVSIAGTLDAVARDPDDNAVLECALTASARFIITGDEDLLVLHPFQGIKIVRAAEFLRRLEIGEIKD